MAIAGGVGIILSPDSIMHLNNLGFPSQEGHSLAFDANASGYGRGEGCGVLVLKKLDRAIEDDDTVRTIIRASGVNSDGWTQGESNLAFDRHKQPFRLTYLHQGSLCLQAKPRPRSSSLSTSLMQDIK